MEQHQERNCEQPLRILVVCQYYAPEPFRLADICKSLVAMGHQVTVVTGTPNYPEGVIYPGYEKGARADELLEGVTVHRCPLIPRKTGPVFRFLNYYSFVFTSSSYLRRMKEEYDVVLINQLSPVMMAQGALDWAKRHGKRSVLYCLDLWPESLLLGGIRKDSGIYRLFWNISRKIYSRTDQILLPSQGFRSYFEEVLKIPGNKLHYLPQYAEGVFDRLPQVEKEPGTVNFLFAGNIGVAQGVETMVQAARMVADDPRIRLHIVGSGIRLESCKALAEGLENVRFYGRRELSEMPGFYAMADGLLIGLSRDSGMSRYLPGKLQSYMASGKAVLGAVEGETARVIREADCGECAPTEDAAGLAALLRLAADQPDRLAAWGKNARSYYCKYFSQEHFMAELTRILAENRLG